MFYFCKLTYSERLNSTHEMEVYISEDQVSASDLAFCCNLESVLFFGFWFSNICDPATFSISQPHMCPHYTCNGGRCVMGFKSVRVNRVDSRQRVHLPDRIIER